jgi:hypothetical protein
MILKAMNSPHLQTRVRVLSLDQELGKGLDSGIGHVEHGTRSKIIYRQEVADDAFSVTSSGYPVSQMLEPVTRNPMVTISIVDAQRCDTRNDTHTCPSQSTLDVCDYAIL